MFSVKTQKKEQIKSPHYHPNLNRIQPPICLYMDPPQTINQHIVGPLIFYEQTV